MSGATRLSDIVIDDARVSWHHAVLRPDGRPLDLEDENSTNGTYADGRRIHEWDVGPGSVIHFGSPSDGPRAVLWAGPRGRPTVLPPSRCRGRPGPSGGPTPYGRCPPAPSASAVRRQRPGRRRPAVSRHHAEFRALPGRPLRDRRPRQPQRHVSSTASRSTGRPRRPDDIVGIGHSTFRLVGDRLEEFVDTGEVSFSARTT